MRDHYQDVTNLILASLENGVAPWIRPWNAGGILPRNLATGRTYRGINVLLLSHAETKHCFASNEWLTFNQAVDMGARVRKGEVGTRIFFFKMREIENQSEGGEEKRHVPMLQSFVVFNRNQIDNLPVADTKALYNSGINVEFEAVIRNTGAVINHGFGRAVYNQMRDQVFLPDVSAFNTMGDYYCTLAHEITHWTGHESRLNRRFGRAFADEWYAKEELVAELGAAFLCAEHGVPGNLQHPEYIHHWLSALRNDKRFIFQAASMAQKACDFVLGRSFNVEVKAAA